MTDVRPRWVHYRQDGFCEQATLQADGRVFVSLSGYRGRGGAAPHAPGRTPGTWHDLDECKPVPPPAPRAVDFATAFAAMQAGRPVRDGLATSMARWGISDGAFAREGPDLVWRADTLTPSVVAAPWYLDAEEEGETDGH